MTAQPPRKVDVLVVSTVHPAFDTRIFLKQARSLAEAGYSVKLVVQHQQNEIVDGVEIVPLPKARSRSDRMLGGGWRALRLAFSSKARLVHFHDPELIPVAMVLKLMGRKVIYDVHEDLPRQILNKYWLPPLFRRAVSFFAAVVEWMGGLVFDRIVAATPKIAVRFPKSKTIVVHNYPRLDEFMESEAMPYEARPPEFAYVGGVTAERGGVQMVRAIGLVNRRITARLTIAGSVVPQEYQTDMAREEGWEHVDYRGQVSRREVGEILPRARAGLVVFQPTPNHIDALPNKMFEYMSAGIPVIASDFPLWRDIIAKSGAGLLVNPESPEEIAKAIEWILAHPEEARQMGLNGRQAIKERYHWESEKEKLLAMYEELC